MYTDYTEDKEENYYADDDNNKKFDNEKLKRIAFFVLIFVILIILIILIAKGCTKKNNNNGMALKESEITIVISKESISLNAGETLELFGDILNPDVVGATISWYSEDSTIADVTDEGQVLANSEGTTNVVASYKDILGNIHQSKCLVTVTSNNITPESISLGAEEMAVKLGDTILLQVSVSPVEAKLSDLVFKSEDESIVTVDENGFVKAVGLGTTSVVAKSIDETVSSSIIINVTETGTTEINPTKIMLIGLSNGVSVGTESKIIYNILPSNATNTNVTWTSSDPSVAVVENDIVTGLKAGKCTIIGTTENGLSDKLDIIVESSDVPVSSIAIDGDTSITLNLGGTRLLKYTISPDNATNKNVTYSTNNSNVIFIDSNGVIAGIGEGVAIVTITTEDGQKTAVLNVSVTKYGTESSTSTETSSNTTGDSETSESNSSSSSSSDSSSSGGYTVSSNDTSSNSCDVDSFIIESNQSTARTSNIKFEKAIAFTNANPGLRVTKYDSCINTSKSKYNLWYLDASEPNTLNPSRAATVPNHELPSIGNIIPLNKGNGYYYVKVDIVTNDGKSYSKYYYAKVEKSGSATNIINITSKLNSTGTVFTVKNVSSNTIRLAACTTKSETLTDTCKPQLNNSTCGTTNYCQIRGYKPLSKNSSTTYSITQNTTSTPTSNRGGKICFKAYDTKGNSLSDTECEVVRKNTTSTTNSKAISSYITVSPKTVSSGNNIKITKNSSSVKKVYYCVRKDTSSCTPVVNKTGLSNNVYYGVMTISGSYLNKPMKYNNKEAWFDKGVKICFKPYGETAFLTTESVCSTIKK